MKCEFNNKNVNYKKVKTMKFEKEDLEVLKSRNISEQQVESQLKMLQEGFPYLRIAKAATVGDGIFRMDEKMEAQSVDLWQKYLQNSPVVVKMVPASGAASRMFKDVFEFYNSGGKKVKGDAMKKFFNEIEDFAFFRLLNKAAVKTYGKSVLSLLSEDCYHEVAGLLLNEDGLGYGKLPKALLEFHKEPGGSRTPIEEHLAEGAQYAWAPGQPVRVHFTVSAEHVPLVEQKVEEVQRVLEKKYGVKYEVSFSVQKPSTDTVAALPSGEIFREDGKIFFRPGGHGALIENLGDLDADVVFIKNIDNVVPDSQRKLSNLYKSLIGGVLVAVKEKLYRYCELLEGGKVPSEEVLAEMVGFAEDMLCIRNEGVSEMSPEEKAAYLYGKFNRPLRVCGMVRNEGEPGGGPFLVYGADGSVQPQILESSQLNPKDAKKLLKEASHFNPVDLVCSLKDWRGKKFDLKRYVDASTGFISEKSRSGVEFKALELPGLWNGAMADWNTVFVEVPGETFNPVKTVVDLLRDAHK